MSESIILTPPRDIFGVSKPLPKSVLATIQQLSEGHVSKRNKLLNSLTLDSYGRINVLALAINGCFTPQTIADKLVEGRDCHGGETSLGSGYFQQLAVVFGCIPIHALGIDFDIKKLLLTFSIQQKSSPNPTGVEATKGAINALVSRIRNGDADRGILGCATGRKEEISGFIIKALSDLHDEDPKMAARIIVLTGKDYWHFLSDDPNCWRKIVEVAYRSGKSNTALKRKKKCEIAQELERLYGRNERFWARFSAAYS